MTPRRLLPYVLIFLVLGGVYGGLRWRQEKRVAQEEQAKKVFHLKEDDISDLTLDRGKEVIRLVKKDKIWYLSAPLETKADQTTVDSMLTTLARLHKERDLGVEKDLKSFGLDKPALVVKFTAKEQAHQLAVGAKVPGDQNYYVLEDQNPHLLMISQGSKDSLDRQLLALRDKTLVPFISSEVKGVKIKTAENVVDLEKTGPQIWRWSGRPDFRVRSDRVEKLLREVHLARAKNFLAEAPKNMRPLGLVPRLQTEITVVTSSGDQTLFLGAKKDDTVYARTGSQGPIMLVDAALPVEINKTLAALEDRRLWSGDILAVGRVVWGSPGKTWTAKKEKETWQITGPDQAATQLPAARLEMALWNFQKLEAGRTLPKGAASTGKPVFVADLFDQGGNSLFHLEAMGVKGTDLEVITRAGDKTVTALVPQAAFRQWQEEMHRLTATAKKDDQSKEPEKGKK
jgi:hypothetical protein